MKEVFQSLNVEAIKTSKYQFSRIGLGINFIQLFVGIIVLFLGVLFYSLFRSAENVYFLEVFKITLPSQYPLSSSFFIIENRLPTFIHVFAFILITAAIVPQNKRYISICFFWFFLDVLFEIGQGVGETAIPFIPDWFSDIMFLENTKNYFLQGSFDYLDLFSITLGAFVAYVFLITTKQKRRGEDEKQAINCS